MNKTEKIICLLLGLVLAWYVYTEMGRQRDAAKAAAEAAIAATNETAHVAAQPAEAKEAPAAAPVKAAPKVLQKPIVPEETVVLENDLVKLELSSWGAVVKRVTLKNYAKDCGDVSADNPPVTLDFSASPLGALGGVGDLAENAAYRITSRAEGEVVFANELVERKVSLKTGYQVVYDETFLNHQPPTNNHQPPTTNHQPTTTNHQPTTLSTTLSLGSMRMGDSKNDLLSVDSFARDAGKGKPGVIHHGDDDSPLKPYLVGGLVGGCSGSKSAEGMPAEETVRYPGAQRWVALKNRFFVTALASSTQGNGGFEATVARDLKSSNYRPDSLSAVVRFDDTAEKRTSVFYVGPKKQALLWDLGMKDVMEFGIWRWLCYPLVWVLNFFHGLIPNYGVAIILLTILVRILFWPLTHKSTVGMKKLQEIQPKMKEIQQKFKDNPQRMQQETWALYKSEKVNPMSSCLPMLIQIPVFIALFNVLRSAVELRYAPFLWIADLSEPEGLLAAYLPFGGLNILPILMAVSTALQSAFTPSTGDKSQQRMMMIMMPAMMLVMFYSFPSALSLYWFLSNLFSIVQMWLIRRQTAKEQAVIVPEVIDPPQTRQMRRHA